MPKNSSSTEPHPLVGAFIEALWLEDGLSPNTLAAYRRDLEALATSFDGVQKCYAIQAGRELRVIVESDKVNDAKAAELSFTISQKIQNDMTYPGQVRVTVIRETRAVTIAK